MISRVKVNSPHASEKLNKTTVTESQGDDDVGGMDTSSSQVDQAEDEGGQGEGAQTQRSRVGEFAAFNRLVETRLEFTTESWRS